MSDNTPMTDDEAAIRHVVDRWLAATREGDGPAVLDLMTEDAVFMVPGQEPFGKEAFAAAADGMRGVTIDGTGDILELGVLGEWAFIRTRLEMTMTPADGTPMRRAGHTLTLLRKCEDGRWRVARDANLLVSAG